MRLIITALALLAASPCSALTIECRVPGKNFGSTIYEIDGASAHAKDGEKSSEWWGKYPMVAELDFSVQPAPNSMELTALDSQRHFTLTPRGSDAEGHKLWLLSTSDKNGISTWSCVERAPAPEVKGTRAAASPAAPDQ
jgi:hypothetical protein